MVSRQSRDVTYLVKQDGFINKQAPVIEYAAKRLSEEIPHFPFLVDYLNPSVTLVPAPRSSPLVPNALWVPKRICDALGALGLVKNVFPCVTRTKPVQKSASAGAGQRPSPQEHYDSLEVTPGLFTPTAITVVDDVITRGSTFLAILKRLEESFPWVPIRCFALVRTISPGEVSTILDPVEGTITTTGGQLHRHP